jgi:two-component system, chemotaxis family, sensor kinase CheA
MSGIDLSQFHQVFFEESFEWLDAMEQELVDLDPADYDPESINTIFRAAHSVKGGSGTFGFNDVAEFTHGLETLLDEIRGGKRSIDKEKIDVFLLSVDCLRDMLTALQDHDPVDLTQAKEIGLVFDKMLAIDEGGETPNVESSAAPAETSDATANEEVQSSSNDGYWLVKFVPGIDIIRTGNDPYRIIRELESFAEIETTVHVDAIPEFSHLEPEQCLFSWHFKVPKSVAETDIREVFEWVIDESELSLESIASEEELIDEEVESEVAATDDVDLEPAAVEEKPEEEKPVKTEKAKKTNTEAQSIRVGIDKVDSLINLVGELVITQSMLGQIGKTFDASRLAKLQEGLAQLEHNSRDLQESVMRIRMLPISFSFSRFPRLVRDLSKQLNKQIELVMVGENTELDKTVMEKIGDPLVHMVRNSLDHGLEGVEERLAAGKSETGTITLNAYHQSGSIIIEVKDDGRGINCERVLQKAIEKGVVGEHEHLSKEQIQELIFHPGFSTADVISDVSGRGVGMDVVKKNIQALNGSIELASEEGKGSTFKIRLPLTLAILDGQLIRVGDQMFIVPLISIVESIQAKSENVNVVAGGSEIYRLRDEFIPIMRLSDVFSVEPKSKRLEEGLLVVVEGDNKKIALFVDDLDAQQQVVIKSLESNYQRVEGVSGATILGDGTVSLIIDIPGLASIAELKMQQYHKRSAATLS